MKHRWSTNLIPFGSGGDKFVPSGYRSALSTKERVLQASKIPGLDGVELHFPGMFEEMDPVATKAFLENVGLDCSIVTPQMANEPAWRMGTLSNPDPTLRGEAIARVKAAMDASVELGASRINLWLGQDGFDYPFQVDYGALWGNLRESVAECAKHNPKVKICVEPKSKEPRCRSLLGTVPRVLLLVGDVAMANVGVLLDTGHALYALENLAEQAVDLIDRNKLFHLHFNDNYGDWDWDMVVGSVHFYEFLELLFWLNLKGYDGWYSLDQYPKREDPAKALAMSIRVIENMETVLEDVDERLILDAVAQCEPLTAFDLLMASRKQQARS